MSHLSPVSQCGNQSVMSSNLRPVQLSGGYCWAHQSCQSYQLEQLIGERDTDKASIIHENRYSTSLSHLTSLFYHFNLEHSSANCCCICSQPITPLPNPYPPPPPLPPLRPLSRKFTTFFSRSPSSCSEFFHKSQIRL